MKTETEKFKNIHTVGLSEDKRTNVWSLTCKKCGKTFRPPTTMLADQLVVCQNRKCENKEAVNYNEL